MMEKQQQLYLPVKMTELIKQLQKVTMTSVVKNTCNMYKDGD